MKLQRMRTLLKLFLCKNGTDDGDAADAAAGKLRHVIACDAADGDDRDFNGIADSSQRFVADILTPGGRLGAPLSLSPVQKEK